MRSSRRNLGLQPDIISEDLEDSTHESSGDQSEIIDTMDNEEIGVDAEETVVINARAAPSVDIDIEESTFSKDSADSDSDIAETRPSQCNRD